MGTGGSTKNTELQAAARNRFAHQRFCMSWLVVLLCCVSAAQKVKTGYDRTANFSVYKTYSWMPLSIPPAHPQIFDAIAGAIDQELKHKGFSHVDAGGDLILEYAGGIESAFGVASGAPILPTYSNSPPAINSNTWKGSLGMPSAVAYVSTGTLELEFVDPKINKVVWRGTLKEKIDFERKKKTFQKIDKAIAKLLKEFPPTT
jgi:Domain of unknown function (DUF4136)